MGLRKTILLLITVITGLYSSGGEITPSDGISLNYTQILFEVPQVKGASKYIFVFKTCNMRSDSCSPLKVIKSKHRAFIADGLFHFGQNYSWYYEAYKGGKKLYASQVFGFSVTTSNLLDTSLQKIVWNKKNNKKRKGILFIDGLKLAINMQGKPVYYLNYEQDHTVRDINLTNQGTITLLDNRNSIAKEMLLNGEVVWMGPSTDQNEHNNEHYHHEFEKLKNGHYIVAGKKKVELVNDAELLDKVPISTLCETIIEYDKDGEEVWRFNILPELKKQFDIQPDMHIFNPNRLGHLNGIAVDEGKNLVYASFKTFNTVMKIDKKNKTIMYMYGAKKINFSDSMESALSFSQQHCPVLLRNGNLMIFNNGTHKTGSGWVELKTGDDINKTNEVVDSFYFRRILSKDFYTPQMGSVQEMRNGDILVGMGNQSHFLEMKRGGKLNFHAHTFYNDGWRKHHSHWRPLVNYRVFYYTSLYQYHVIADTITNKEGEIEIRVTNIGTNEDIYTIANEGAANTLISFTLAANKSYTYTVGLKARQTLILKSERSGKEILLKY